MALLHPPYHIDDVADSVRPGEKEPDVVQPLVEFDAIVDEEQLPE